MLGWLCLWRYHTGAWGAAQTLLPWDQKEKLKLCNSHPGQTFWDTPTVPMSSRSRKLGGLGTKALTRGLLREHWACMHVSGVVSDRSEYSEACFGCTMRKDVEWVEGGASFARWLVMRVS